MSITKVETIPLEQMEFKNVIPCEGTDHWRSASGHKVDEPAAYYVVTPCCGRATRAQCKPRIEFMMSHGVLTCTYCKKDYILEIFHIVPV